MVGYSYKPSDSDPTANSSYYLYDSSPAPSITFSTPPARSDWQCYLFGDADNSGPGCVVFIPAKGNEPNWFHRKMQELCFGIQWRKRK